jgi:uncharacterized protein
MATDNAGVIDNTERHRYELSIGSATATLLYRRDPGRITLIHTEVPEVLRGQGVATKLAQFALEDAQARGLKVIPMCPFVRRYLGKHPEYAEIVEQT